MAAGTDRDLMSLARLAVRSVNGGTEAGPGDCETFGGGFAVGLVCMPLRTFCTVGITLPLVCEAHIDATAATLPPRPPRAERISYFASGPGVGGKLGKRGS